MSINKKSKLKEKLSLSIFELIFLIWSGGVMLSIVLAILGIFYPSVVGGYLLLSVFIIWRLQKKEISKKNNLSLAGRLIIKKFSRSEQLLLVSLIIFASFLSFFTIPTIFGGRDEGSLSTSALLINRDHALKHQGKLIDTFGTIYGEGKALNFPGFFYQKNNKGHFILKSQFLPGYSSYLANFAWPKHINLVKYANALPLIIFLLAFYSVIKLLTFSSPNSVRSSILGTVLLASVVPLGLFYKFTLSEIFFASLLWPSLYFLIKYLKQKGNKFSLWCYWLIFIPLLPTVFVRIEALGIIFTLILILILTSHKQLQKPNYQAPILLLILMVVASLFIFSDFFVIALKGLLNSFGSSNDFVSPTKISHSFIPKNWKDFYLFKLFYSYNLIPLFFFAIIGIFKLFKEKAWLILTPLFFLGITSIYLIDANISMDHPWMLRRFVFAIIPLAVLYTIIFSTRYPLRQKSIQTAIIFLIIASNVIIAIPFITFKQNINLLEQVENLSKEFKTNDLILVSQKSSGSGWSLISEPLRTIYNKQAVYFFNPNDYTEIDTNKFNKIYLITSNREIDLYNKKLSLKKVKDYSLKNQLIQPTKDPLRPPKFILTKTKGVIYEVIK